MGEYCKIFRFSLLLPGLLLKTQNTKKGKLNKKRDFILPKTKQMLGLKKKALAEAKIGPG